MSSRHTHTYVPVPVPTDDVTHIKVSVSYRAGGMNYATYKTDPRGYYLSIGPVALSVSDRCTTEKFSMFSAAGFVLEPATRFSATRMALVAAKFLTFGIPDKLAATFLSGDRAALEAEVRAA